MDNFTIVTMIVLQWRRKYPWENIADEDDPEWLDYFTWNVENFPTEERLKEVDDEVNGILKAHPKISPNDFRVIKRTKMITLTEVKWR
jgi:hypothetical protein